MVKKIFVNPVIASAVLCAVLIYTGIIIPKNKYPYKSLVPEDRIISALGTVCSNPVKSSAFGGAYKADFFLESARSLNGECSESTGKITLFFPTDIVEAFFPGKIYTKSKGKKGIFIENGAKLRADFKKSGDFFYVTNAELIGWKSVFAKCRGACRLQFRRMMYGWGNAGGLLLALLSGCREYTEQTVSDSFRNAGLSHILALSGMHLSLFGGIAFFFGKKWAGRKWAEAAQLLATMLFVLFAGLSPSLFRAFLCSLILFLNWLLRLSRPSSVSVLSASFLIHTMIFPEHLKEAAFLLSYASLAGILILSGTITKIISPAIFPKIRKSLGDSAAAQILTAPVAVSIFGKIMPVGVIASVVVSPLVTIFLYAGLFSIVTCLALPFLSNGFNVIMNCLYYVIKISVCFFSHAPSIKVG
ncbi:MAG: ComEC/Rec2 family competence protein [Treponema sp.]|nr:ComEC/Rec2 family competence protein [Treponema sp.]